MTRISVPLTRLRGSGRLRTTVVDGTGKRVWSNPVRVPADASQNFWEYVTQG